MEMALATLALEEDTSTRYLSVMPGPLKTDMSKYFLNDKLQLLAPKTYQLLHSFEKKGFYIDPSKGPAKVNSNYLSFLLKRENKIWDCMNCEKCKKRFNAKLLFKILYLVLLLIYILF